MAPLRDLPERAAVSPALSPENNASMQHCAFSVRMSGFASSSPFSHVATLHKDYTPLFQTLPFFCEMMCLEAGVNQRP